MTEIMDGQIMMAEAEAIGRVEEKDDDEREYKAFVEKFKPKKTTDDCYTPEKVYDAVADWVSKEYNVPREKMVRPFWPGGDYQAEDYPEGCVVVDNPPFSILAQITDWYNERGIPFFLFCPALTAIHNLNGKRIETNCVIVTMIGIVYANGADVNTSFVTNLDRKYIIRTVPEFYEAVYEAVRETVRERALAGSQLPKYEYPAHVMTGREYWARDGVAFDLERGRAVCISALDEQRSVGKTVFGHGLLLSDTAAIAAERAAAIAAERAAARKRLSMEWKLSEREKAICREMDGEQVSWGLMKHQDEEQGALWNR